MKNFVIPALGNSTGDELSDYLNSSIESFSEITGIPVTYFNAKNEIVKEYKKDDKICNIFYYFKMMIKCTSCYSCFFTKTNWCCKKSSTG